MEAIQFATEQWHHPEDRGLVPDKAQGMAGREMVETGGIRVWPRIRVWNGRIGVAGNRGADYYAAIASTVTWATAVPSAAEAASAMTTTVGAPTIRIASSDQQGKDQNKSHS